MTIVIFIWRYNLKIWDLNDNLTFSFQWEISLKSRWEYAAKCLNYATVMFKKKHRPSLVFGAANFPKIIFVFCMLVCVCMCVRGGDSAICNKLLLSEMIKTNKKGINLKLVSITY